MTSAKFYSKANISKIFAFFAIVTIGIALDALSKSYFSRTLELGQSIPGPGVLDSIFHYTLVHNTGAAWGIFGDSTFILGVFSLIVSICILAVVLLNSGKFNIALICGMALITSGGIGNAIDRLSLGYVVDFIEFSFFEFPVFNIADTCVSVGIVLALIGFIFYEKSKSDAGISEEVVQGSNHE